MYNSNYSQAAFGSAARKTLKKPQGKSCGYYTRVILFFCSLIQTLIIISLVLFLIYGRSPDASAESRVQELEKSYGQVFMDNIKLREQRKNLSLVLNSTQTEKIRMEAKLAKLNPLLEKSIMIISNISKQYSQCEAEKRMLQLNHCKNCLVIPTNGNCKETDKIIQLQQLLALQKDNFSRIVNTMKEELETTAKARDTLNLETISLRRDKNFLKTELDNYRKKCKGDFVKSLDGISNVTKAFLLKIDTLMPIHTPFLLTCAKQTDHFNQIRNNCTSLSHEVETKFQYYLDNVGSQVSEIQAVNARLEVEKARLAEDNSFCSRNRSAMAHEYSETLRKTQEKNDMEKERTLLDLNKCRSEKEFQQGHVNILQSQIRDLNYSLATCGFRPSMGNPVMSSPGNTFGATGSRDLGYNIMGSHSFTNPANKQSSTNPLGSSYGLGLSVVGKVGQGVDVLGGTGGVRTGGTGGVGTGGVGMGKVNSGATQVDNRAPGGAGWGWPGSSPISPAGARLNGVGMGASNPFSLAAINQHLRELQQFSNTKPSK
ncbi:hypothetical protein UPYG_G00298130 [Umbra pygmaea]|uniref:Plasmalemma vesicle-associated protein-like n=1 Tax=Umbra pygmaea TaxID=75934 RepID=A0ABD0W6X4_UMBPY